MILAKKHLIAIGLTVVIILTILFNIGEFTQKTAHEYFPSIPTRSQTSAVSDFNSSLVVHYTFDDTTNDSAGSNHGTAVGGPTYVAGKVGSGALSFDGTDDYLNLGAGTTLAGGSAITVSAWVKPTSATGEIASRRDQSEGTMSWEFHVSGGNAKFGIAVSAGSNPDYTVTSGSTINVNGSTWTHVAATYTTADGILRMYINGILDGTTSSSGVALAAQAVTKNLIGAYTNSSGQPANLFSGAIDELRIYDRALTASEIKELYNYTGSGGGIVVTPQTCSSFTYSVWSTCVNSQQTRTVTGNNPNGCTGGNPVTTQSCTTPDTPPITPPTTPPVILPISGDCLSTNIRCVDDTPGSSQEYSTVQGCVSVAQPGDTCLVRAGTYNETVFTVRNGTGDSRIIIRGESGAQLHGLRVSHQYIRVEGFTFDGINTGQQSAIRLYNGARNFQFVNNTVAHTPLNVRALSVDYSISEIDSPHDILLEGNQFINIGDHTIGLDGTKWLVKDNYFENTQGWDAIICTASDSIFTGNVFRISNPYGNANHTDIIQTDHFGDFTEISKNIIFEKNIIIDALTTQIGNLSPGPVTSMGWWTFRNNVYTNISMQANIGLHDTYWYNNTFYRATQNTGSPLLFVSSLCLSLNDPNCFGSGYNGRVFNNIFIESGSNTSATGYGWYGFGANATGGVGDYNMVAGINGVAKTTFNEVHGINGGNPMFVDVGNPRAEGFRLLSGSSLINKGGFLTRITSANGSGQTIQVVDAGYFTDGMGLISGDVIQLEGTNQRARIVGINRDTNTITVSGTLTWNRNQGITLAYEGTAPDIGAYEYTSGATPPPITPPTIPPTYKPGDFNRDGAVNALDFSLLSGAWNQNNSTYDLNTDGIVNSLDYVIMVQNWTG